MRSSVYEFQASIRFAKELVHDFHAQVVACGGAQERLGREWPSRTRKRMRRIEGDCE